MYGGQVKQTDMMQLVYSNDSAYYFQIDEKW